MNLGASSLLFKCDTIGKLFYHVKLHTNGCLTRFVLDLVANGSSSSCTANLNVVETNPFKHLTHLSLKFLPGTDTDVKKYLAHCLKMLKVSVCSVINPALMHPFYVKGTFTCVLTWLFTFVLT